MKVNDEDDGFGNFDDNAFGDFAEAPKQVEKEILIVDKP